MFRKTIIALLAGVSMMSLTGAELKVQNNKILFGNNTMHLWPTGMVSFTNAEGLLGTMYPHFTTSGKDKWYSIGNKASGAKLAAHEEKSWQYDANIPLAEGSMAVKETVAVSPFNAVDMAASWVKPANAKDLIEAAYFIQLPVKNFADTPLIVNGKKLTVANETKYGWFAAALENPVIELYSGIAGSEFSLAFSGKFNVSIGTMKDSMITIRVVLAAGTEIKLAVTPK